MEGILRELPAIIAIIASLISILVAVSKNKAEVRKLNLEGDSSVASATDEVAESAKLLLEPLNDRIATLKKEIDGLKKRNLEQDEEARLRLAQREKEIAELKKVVVICATARKDTLVLLEQMEGVLNQVRHQIEGNGHDLSNLKEFVK